MIPLLALGALIRSPAMASPMAPTPPTPEERLRRFVADPVQALLDDTATMRGFRIIALSNAAEACLRNARRDLWSLDDARQSLARLASAASDPRIRPFDHADGPWGHHNLYVTHWLIVISALAELDPLHSEVRRGPALARHLAEASLAHDSGIARSLPNSPARWPADQAATLYALTLADDIFGLSLAEAPVERFTSTVPARASTVLGLPVSEWTGTGTLHDRPRGSAVAWSVRYLADIAPALAHSWWTTSKRAFRSEGLGLAGFREWPPGDDPPPDQDSGPILLGMSAAATAFAIGASRSMNDCATHAALTKTQQVVRDMINDPDAAGFGGVEAMRMVQQTVLATAIAANQATIPSDCPEPAPRDR